MTDTDLNTTLTAAKTARRDAQAQCEVAKRAFDNASALAAEHARAAKLASDLELAAGPDTVLVRKAEADNARAVAQAARRDVARYEGHHKALLNELRQADAAVGAAADAILAQEAVVLAIQAERHIEMLRGLYAQLQRYVPNEIYLTPAQKRETPAQVMSAMSRLAALLRDNPLNVPVNELRFGPPPSAFRAERRTALMADA